MPTQKDKEKFDWNQVFIGIVAILCALCLPIIALSLRPLAKWAEYQNVCVEQGSVKAPIEWAVRKCNGRSKVYQVK